MIIKINIEAESVEELQEALAGLSQKPVNFATGAESTGATTVQTEPETQQVTMTPAEPEKPAEAPQDAPELGAPQYGDPAASPTIDQIAAAGAKLLDEDANKMSALLDLLGKYSVQAITQLKPEQLAGFAADLRALGAEV